MNVFISLQLTKNNFDFLPIKITSKRVRGNNVDFSTIEITSKKGCGNIVDFLTSEITLIKVRGNNVDSLIMEITSKKVPGNKVEFLTVEITSKKVRGNNMDFSTSQKSTSKKVRGDDVDFRSLKLHWKSTWNRHGNSPKFGLRRIDVTSTLNQRGFDVVCPLGWLNANCTKDVVVVGFSSNEKAKQCLAGKDLLVECCDSGKVVCLLITDSKGKVFGVGEVTEVIRFGDLKKLLRMTAYVCPFVTNLKLQIKGDELIVGQLRFAEICEAEKMWIRYEQSIISKKEEKIKKLTASLNLFYHNEQLIRLNTRLNRSTQLHYENKNPLLLRGDSHFSKLIFLR